MKAPILLTVMAALVSAPFTAKAADLTLAFSTRGNGGSIAIAVYRDAVSFRRSERPLRTLTVPRSGATTTATIADLPPGRYAVAAFHDTDGDGELSTWPVGLPKEAYGFSNDARGRFGPPDFDAAAFDLPASGLRLAIRLR